MAVSILIILIVFIQYVAVSTMLTGRAEKKLNISRKEVVGLYVRRVNLMPHFLTAARKHSPVPMELYNRFIKARDEFARADKETCTRAANIGIRKANAELDTIFSEFFSHYSGCREALYIKTQEDYTKIMEKRNFAAVFYEQAWESWLRIGTSPLMYGAAIGAAFLDVFRSNIFKRGEKREHKKLQ